MSRIFFIVLSTIVFLVGQSPYIRSTLPVRDGILYNPDSGRPFSEFATEYFDNGQVKVKGRYSGGFANGYWSYYHPNGQIKARGRYYKAIDSDQNKIIENGRAGKWIYWFNNGTKQMTGIYKNGQMDGNWVFGTKMVLNILKVNTNQENFMVNGRLGMQTAIYRKLENILWI